MKKIRMVVIGYGDRGSIYASYALQEKEQVEVVAVVDVSKDRLNLAKKIHGLNDNQLFTDVDEFLRSGIECDYIVNATMDQQHYDVLKKILPLGKYVLTEKPIVNSKEKLLELKAIADKSGSTVFVGHVLRYSPFYKTIKQIILSGDLGTITSMELAEHVAAAHYSGSYARGRWRSEKECGSTFLLAKSCHDTDLLCWLNNSTRPTEVSSFGGRYYYVPKNAPKDSTKMCVDCPHKETCIYSAVKMYGEGDLSPEVTHPKYHKEVITEEDRMEFIKKDIFGECIYKIEGNDLVDRQATIINYENGSIATFVLSAGAAPINSNRTIFVLGSNGELEGNIETGIVTVRINKGCNVPNEVRVIDVKKLINSDTKLKGHNGGDYEISKSIIDYINGDRSSISLTQFSDSIYGHLLAYGADESRIAHKIVEIEKL